MKWIALFASLIASQALAAANPDLLPDRYTILCQTALSVGMNWSNGAWIQTRFTPNTYVVVNSPTNNCLLQIKHPPQIGPDGKTQWREVCLNTRILGTPFVPAMSEMCTEYYEPKGSFKGVSIRCPGHFEGPIMNLDPEGEFDRSFLQFNLSKDPDKGYKDSQFIETGNCSLMR